MKQHCNCNNDKAPVCCKDGWKLIYTGLHFTHRIKSNYSPTEGEALAISWSLESSKMFPLGCNNLIVSTDHHSLVGIFGNRELCNINICNVKEKTLKFNLNGTMEQTYVLETLPNQRHTTKHDMSNYHWPPKWIWHP